MAEACGKLSCSHPVPCVDGACGASMLLYVHSSSGDVMVIAGEVIPLLVGNIMSSRALISSWEKIC